VDLSKIKDWLKPPDPSTNFVNATNKMTEGTGAWLLQDWSFQNWETDAGLMWLQGQGKYPESESILFQLMTFMYNSWLWKNLFNVRTILRF